ncbi:MAG: carboxymuconolactone decarboxylase family protein [Oscillospiraceae bacterium]|nr:carboxymuconolactone decarboxylase family protein [Oscillospiraceae bacterium]MCL2125846.1 carboxymuconolactone decarboxylase family protein [Oscillospiraceae bacterium]
MAEKHFIEVLREEAPAVSEAFFNLAGTIEKDGGLDAKTFQLIYLAIKATVGEVGAVSAHAGMAKKAGATRAEVLGAVLVSLMTNGVHGVSACLPAVLDAYDNA